MSGAYTERVALSQLPPPPERPNPFRMKRRTFLATAAAALATPAQGSDPVVAGTESVDAAFRAWLDGFRKTAVSSGLPADLVDRELSGLTPDPRVRGSDRNQPEFSRPFSHYVRRAASEDQAAIGRRRLASLDAGALSRIEAERGVPREILGAIWGMESGYGAAMGDQDVIRSMATLAADGRRRAFAEEELLSALRMLASREVSRTQLVGSWAGAMGQTQFIPSSFLRLAVDGDGDGRRDVWGSAIDALASSANLLSQAGWKRREPWAIEAIAPKGFDYSVCEVLTCPLSQWADLGVSRPGGDGWPDGSLEASLIAPTGAGGPLFLLLANHFVIRRYNNAVTYAVAVGLLADRIAGRPGPVRPWPEETPLSLSDRTGAQTALKSQGYDVGEVDGVMGLKSRQALRAWQKSQGLVADGYLSPDMIARLRSAS